MKFTIHREAQDEATSYVAWYRERNPQVAERLAELFGAAIEVIARQPASFPRLEYRRNPGNIAERASRGFR
jgi:plasmid stabilization system protein ParE